MKMNKIQLINEKKEWKWINKQLNNEKWIKNN